MFFFTLITSFKLINEIQWIIQNGLHSSAMFSAVSSRLGHPMSTLCGVWCSSHVCLGFCWEFPVSSNSTKTSKWIGNAKLPVGSTAFVCVSVLRWTGDMSRPLLSFNLSLQLPTWILVRTSFFKNKWLKHLNDWPSPHIWRILWWFLSFLYWPCFSPKCLPHLLKNNNNTHMAIKKTKQLNEWNLAVGWLASYPW